MKKLVGILFILIGLVALASAINVVKAKIAGYLPVINSINPPIILIGGLVLLILGGFLLSGKGGVKRLQMGNVEVPIFKGNRIVGYRQGE